GDRAEQITRVDGAALLDVLARDVGAEAALLATVEAGDAGALLAGHFHRLEYYRALLEHRVDLADLVRCEIHRVAPRRVADLTYLDALRPAGETAESEVPALVGPAAQIGPEE